MSEPKPAGTQALFAARRAPIDQDTPTGLPMHRRAKRSTTGRCGGHASSTAGFGGDPMDDCYPQKPPRMRWATYDRLVDELIAAVASRMNGCSCWLRSLALYRDAVAPSGQPVRVRRGPRLGWSKAPRAPAAEGAERCPDHRPQGGRERRRGLTAIGHAMGHLALTVQPVIGDPPPHPRLSDGRQA
jgi:hypothetical protein